MDASPPSPPVPSRLPPDRSGVSTEGRLGASRGLDAMSARQVVAVMNAEDRRAAEAAAAAADDVARAAELVADRLGRGGRLVYFGAGTSGRLGVLDASECPPTFLTDPRQVVGVIAGGPEAVFRAVEGAEDDPAAARRDVDALDLGPADVAAGIAAGGSTPYVLTALARASERGSATVFVTCAAAGGFDADVVIRAVTGPEVLTGSTRLKAGTATKLVLNQITTTAMILLGKCYDNLMVDLRATNVKLHDRAIRIVGHVAGTTREESARLLAAADGRVKVAIVIAKIGHDPAAAERLLARHGGRLRAAIGQVDADAAPPV